MRSSMGREGLHSNPKEVELGLVAVIYYGVLLKYDMLCFCH